MTHFYSLRCFLSRGAWSSPSLFAEAARKEVWLTVWESNGELLAPNQVLFSSAMQRQTLHVSLWVAVAMADRRRHRERACISPRALCHTWRLAPFTNRHISGRRAPDVLCLNWVQGVSRIQLWSIRSDSANMRFSNPSTSSSILFFFTQYSIWWW